MNIYENENIIIREATVEDVAALTAADGGCVICGDDRIFAVAAPDGTLYGAIAQRRYTEWSMEGIAFLTLTEYRRRGYAAQAVRAFTRWFYDSSTENMLTAVVDLENVPAVRTLERAGYEYIRTTTLCRDNESRPEVFHLFLCTRAAADAGAPPRGCCCGCGGHAEEQ